MTERPRDVALLTERAVRPRRALGRVTYSAVLGLRGQHHNRGAALFPRHLPEVRTGVRQRPLASDVLIYYSRGRNFHLKGHKNKIVRIITFY